MNREAIEKYGPLAAARKSALMSQKDMVNEIGGSVPTILGYEKEPKTVPLGVLAAIYRTVGNDGRGIIKAYVTDLFCPKI